MDEHFRFQRMLDLIKVELQNANETFGPFASAHEGWAVIQEEVEELWDEVKKKQWARSKVRMRNEAVQIAAMAIRFAMDLCPAELSLERLADE